MTKIKHTILVVEDEKSLLTAIVDTLEKSDFTVFKARSVDEAFAILSKEKVEAIWLDHYLLGAQSGLDLLSELKKESSVWSKIPVFVVSNTASNDKVRQYLAFDVVNYYVKSEVKIHELVEEIKSFIHS